MPAPSVIENRKMLYYNKILKSEGIDEQRTDLGISKECDICHFYFFKTETFYISLMFAMDVMIFHYVQSR